MTGKRILVTGAGSGFGREVALRLAAKGHCVIAGVQIAPQITELSAEAARRGLALDAVKLDVTCARERAQAARWDVDVLLNNAGAGEAGALVDLPVDIVRELFETNVFGPLELTQQVARGMIARGRGRIVFVSSIAGLITGAYCASKHALEAIAEAMHLELAAHGVQIAVVNPGPYRTGFNDRMMETPRRWLDPARDAATPETLTFPLEQFDPQEMIEKMVDVTEADGGLFRNLLPAAAEQIVRDEQAHAWTRRQNERRGA
ncbi:SDR family oxidoreductase [Burkholderia pseudomallei]|uniref:SDR family oxidoreductase n=2 Tax=Burkholderia pseudomallei TaxID=28450 RepID=UPI00018A5027|nr:SDR family oxidoreductase [Burkholderia pseudomallei]AIO96868.1 short chain dehydrogenase family protein [Burkholderia pseudomallei 576]AIP58969.1 short chain dehydrogenase family protein [Burkholderia pseudomallei HBPUB10303a]AYX06447.1 SDR family oxidoreductase [Burkholderia pseudomallei]EEC35095.1 oxidoreductase, short-chain dehydrogenase/reductase family [Burkholderia pseudomallei 576]KGD30977.1 short chain dehydrogenase family protein [Burkholderia pseudomallei]